MHEYVHGSQKSMSNSLEFRLQTGMIGVTAIEPRSSARTSAVLNCLAIFPVSISFSLTLDTNVYFNKHFTLIYISYFHVLCSHL